MPEKKEFVMLPRNPERDALIAQAKDKLGGGSGVKIQNSKTLETALKFLVANWDHVQKTNPKWADSLDG